LSRLGRNVYLLWLSTVYIPGKPYICVRTSAYEEIALHGILKLCVSGGKIRTMVRLDVCVEL